MTDLLRDGVSWLAGQQEAQASESFLYSRGSLQVSVTGVLGTTLLALTDDMGQTRMEWTDRDIIIRAKLLQDAGLGDPLRGDRIQIAFSDGTTEYLEVLPYGDEPPWRWSDPHRIRYRIHLKKVSASGGVSASGSAWGRSWG